MTRLVYDKCSKTFGFEDKFLWFWVERTAMDSYGNDLPCLLVGFSTLTEAISEAQSDFYIHESCFPFLNEHTRINMRTQEELNKLRQELLKDDSVDKVHGYRIRNNYDYFLENYINELIVQLQDLDKQLRDAHEDCGYDYDIRDLL